MKLYYGVFQFSWLDQTLLFVLWEYLAVFLFYHFRRLWAVLLVWSFVSTSSLSLANSYVEILAPRGDGISGWGIWKVPKSWGLNSPEGNYCLKREVLESFLALPTMWGYSKKSETWRGLPPDHPGTQVSDFQPPEL